MVLATLLDGASSFTPARDGGHRDQQPFDQ